MTVEVDYLDWVDFELGSSLGWWATSVATAKAGWWNIPNLCQPNQGTTTVTLYINSVTAATFTFRIKELQFSSFVCQPFYREALNACLHPHTLVYLCSPNV